MLYKINYLYRFVVLLIVALFTSSVSYAQLDGYSSRIKAKVNASQVVGDSDLTNFPVLVSLTHVSLKTTGNGGLVYNANGYDISFTSNNATTLLSHQLESYDASTGAIEFWVRFPTLSATTDTEFYIYFGNSSISSDQSSTNVWDSNYKLVLHLNEIASGPTNFTDASGEIPSTDISDNATTAATGQIGGGREFNDPGTNDVISIADNGVSPLDITGSITISLWINGDDITTDSPDLIAKGDYTNGYSLWVSSDEEITFSVNGDDLESADNAVTNNTWYYIVATRNTNGDRIIYRNGVQIASDNSNQSFSVNNENVTLSSFGSWDFEGIMDEVRISNIVRDSAWIATEYNNQSSPGSFVVEINAEPILGSIESSSLIFNSGDSPTSITSSLVISDGNDTNIESATVAITSNFNGPEDVLGFVNQNGITGSYSSSTGILSLSGSATLANYQTALRSVTYQNTDPAPNTAIRAISFTVNDGDDDSNTETRNIQVVKLNSAPTVFGVESSNLLYFAGGGEKTITNTIEITDLDNTNLDSAFIKISSGYLTAEDTLRFVDQLGITGSWDDVSGQLKLEGTASLGSYQAALRSVTYENESGSPTMTNRTISFSAHDGTEESSTVTRNIEYPTAITELASYKSIGVFHYDAQDADGDGDAATNQPSNGTLSSWGDRSDNVSASTEDISALAPSGDEPTLSSSALGGRGAIIFDGNSGDDGDNFNLPNSDLINTDLSGFTEKSFAAVFRTSNDLSGLQIIYEQGGVSNGYQISIKNGEAYAFTWSTSPTWTGGDNLSINLGTLEANTTYIVIASHDQPTSTWEASINGETIIKSPLVAGTMVRHSGGPRIGEEDGTKDPVTFAGNPSGTNNFTGEIAELVSWNVALTNTDFTNIYAFLSDKWLNTLPVLSGIEVSALSYAEGDPATNISSTISLTDEDTGDDATEIDSAKVLISNGFVSSEDVLAYTTTLGISGSYNSSTGVLTLTGSTTTANYQAALRNITYRNTDNTSPTATTREISFIVYDWDDASGVVTRNIDIAVSNDPPVITNLETTTLAFTEGDGVIPISSGLTLSDNDNTTLQGATIAFTNNYFLGEDELDYINALGITGSFNSITGVLSLTGTTTLTNYQTALRNVQYKNTSTDPVTGVGRTVEIRVFDGTDNSATGSTRDISVSSANTVPALSNIETETIFYQVNQSSILSRAITITDPDDTNIDTVSFRITSNYNSSQDTLEFQSLFGITSSWEDGSGTLTLSGPASKADFQSAIRTVSYRSTVNAPTDTDRIVSITANDGDGNSNTVSRSISFSIPKSLSNLLVWLKGDAGTFTTTSGSTASTEGSDVGRWEDQSGNNNHFTATNSGTEPTFRTNISAINSQDAVEFPGSSGYRLEDIDAEDYLNGLNKLTIFFVLESDDINTDQGFWTTYEPNATGEDRVFSIRYDSQGDNGLADDVITTGMRDLSTAFVMESFEAAQSNVGQIVMLKWSSELNYELYVDGVLSNPTFFQNIPTGVLTNVTTAIIGQGTKDLSSSWDGLIAEVILYGKELSKTEQEDIEDYLSAKYDIAIRSLTAAKGGEAISADNANSTYTTLSGPRVQESFVGEFTSGGTFVFNAPSGFEWDDTNTPAPSASVSSAFGGSTELTVSFTSRTSSQITFTIGTESSTSPGEIKFSNFRVRPTTGKLPNTGIITNSGTTGLGGSTNYGELIMVAGTKDSLVFSTQPTAPNVSSAISPAVYVQVVDQYGNSVEESLINVTIARNIVSGSGTLGGTTTVATNLFGIAKFDSLTLSATGSYTLTASSTGLTSATSSAFGVVATGQLTQFQVERVPSGNISNKQAGKPFNITVVAIDGKPDTVQTFTGTVNISSNCTLGTGEGTTANFVSGVLVSHMISVSSIGTCTITATNSSGSETGTSNSFDVSPGGSSASTFTISASPSVIFNDGFSTSTIIVQAKDSEGNNVTTGGETIVLSTTSGSLSSVTDNSNGTYTAILNSSTVTGIATISGTLNSVSITDNATVEFAEFNNQWQSSVGSVVNAQNWDLATNWSSGVVPISGDKVLIPATPAVGNKQPVINTTNTQIAQLSIESSASVTISGGKELIITGVLSGDGKVLGSNVDSVAVGGDLDISDITVGYVKLDGSTKQEVTTPNSYMNLELDNTSGADFTTDLSVSGTLKLTNGTLFLPTGTTLIANTKVYDNGEIRIQQRMYGTMGWRMLSSPIDTTYGEFLDGVLTQGYSGSTLGNAPLDSLQPTVLTHLENYSGTDLQRLRAPTSSSQKLTQGQGMFVFLFGNIVADSRYNDPLPDTLDVSGREFDGNGTEVDFGVTYTTTADSGWNLVGNPFLATIDWDDNTNWTKTNMESTIYIWDPAANNGNGEYLTWNGTTGTLPNGGLIPPFQGFWVKANNANPVLKVNKSAKKTGGSFLRKQASNKISDNSDTKLIDMALTSTSGRSKKTNIMFSDQGLKSKDVLDAYRLLPMTNSFIEMHTLLGNGTELAINSLPSDFNSRLFIPIYVGSYEKGVPKSEELTFTWGDLRSIPEHWILTLIDNDTGTEVNIMEEKSYTFFHSTKAKTAYIYSPSHTSFKIRQKSLTQNTRFTLKVSTEQIERDVPEEVFLSQNYPNPFNPTTTIPFGLNEDSGIELVIYDVLGRKVQTLISGTQSAGKYQIPFRAGNLASGVYFYRLTTNSKVITKKLMLIK